MWVLVWLAVATLPVRAELDEVVSTRQADFELAIDEHAATAAKVVLPLGGGNDICVNVGLDPADFGYQGFTRFGK
jgi:hypothetical protein